MLRSAMVTVSSTMSGWRPERVGMYAERLARCLRIEAELLEREHTLPGWMAADALESAAKSLARVGDDNPWIMHLVGAGWLVSDSFVITDERARRRMAMYWRSKVPEDLLFTLAVCAAGDHVWEDFARSLRGRAHRFDLVLVGLSTTTTNRPQWESYALRSSQMGTNRIARDSLLGIDRYLAALEARHSR